MQKILIYGDERISYLVEFDATRKERIAINVQADGSVIVDAPEGEAAEVIHQAVRKRSRWIFRHVEEARQRFRDVRPRNYESGETVLYLGRRYVLKLLPPDDGANVVKLKRGRLEVPGDDRSPGIIQSRLRAWYRFRARDYFSRRIGNIGRDLPWMTTTPPFQLLAMTRQWGSCGTSGTIILNPFLIKAPRECIDYVVLHELCHLKEHNHSQHFYRLLDRHMPHWKRIKEKLDEMAEQLLNE